MAEKEMTKEEQEKAIKEKLAKQREIGLKDLNSGLWDYAAPNMIGSDYGKLNQVAEGMFAQTISKVPDEHVYKRLFLPQLMNKGGAITSPYLKEDSYNVLRSAIASITVEDALKYIGGKGKIKDELKDKYVGMLQDKEGNNPLVEMIMGYKTSELIENIGGQSKKESVSLLEEMVAKPKEGKEVQMNTNQAKAA